MSLILLLIMTIIGVAAMNGARLEVRMAGMMQKEEVALRSTERVLAAAERYVEERYIKGVDSFDKTRAGHYLPEDDLQGKLDAAGASWSGIVGLGKDAVGTLGELDIVVVEYLGEITLPDPDSDFGPLNDGEPLPPGMPVSAYRITTRSETDGKAVRIIESVFY